MRKGFITLERQILDWEWYDDLNTTRLFIHCLLRANHRENKWRGISIKRGSFLTSINTLSSETKLSISKIRTSIKKLKSTKEIAIESQAQHTVITVIKYDYYQSSDKQYDNCITRESQSDDKALTTNNNNNNDNNGTIKDIDSPKAHKFDFKKELINLGVDQKLVSDWMAVRRKKKAANTETALRGFLSQVDISGLSISEAVRKAAENSWCGFKAEWIKKTESKGEYSFMKNVEDF